MHYAVGNLDQGPGMQVHMGAWHGHMGEMDMGERWGGWSARLGWGYGDGRVGQKEKPDTVAMVQIRH